MTDIPGKLNSPPAKPEMSDKYGLSNYLKCEGTS
jgi:hypothetical protein